MHWVQDNCRSSILLQSAAHSCQNSTLYASQCVARLNEHHCWKQRRVQGGEYIASAEQSRIFSKTAETHFMHHSFVQGHQSRLQPRLCHFVCSPIHQYILEVAIFIWFSPIPSVCPSILFLLWKIKPLFWYINYTLLSVKDFLNIQYSFNKIHIFNSLLLGWQSIPILIISVSLMLLNLISQEIFQNHLWYPKRNKRKENYTWANIVTTFHKFLLFR